MAKTLAFCITVLTLGIFIYFLVTNKSVESLGTNLKPTVTSAPNKQTLMETSTSFFKFYNECIKGQSGKSDQQRISYCIQHNALAASDLEANVLTGDYVEGNVDPIICSHNPATIIQPDRVMSENADEGTVYIAEIYSGGSQSQLKISLLKEQGSWKVSNVECPRN